MQIVVRCNITGGNWDDGFACGPLYLNVNNPLSASNSNYGALASFNLLKYTGYISGVLYLCVAKIADKGDELVDFIEESFGRDY